MKTSTTVLPDGTYVDAVVGFRIWKMFGDEGSMFLNSVWHPAMWDDHTRCLRAECNCTRPVRVMVGDSAWIDGKMEPREHQCGVYAWNAPHTPPVSVSRSPSLTGLHRIDRTLVAGEVRLWGEVHVHEYGYRAEHAMISGLFTSSDPVTQKRIELAALTYDVPLVTLEEVKH